MHRNASVAKFLAQKGWTIEILRSKRLAFHPGFALGYVVAVLLWLSSSYRLLFTMPCPWKHFLEIPCLTCGTSRSLLALQRMEIARAFQLNPLAPVAALIVAAIILVALVQVIWGYRIHVNATAVIQRKIRYGLITVLVCDYCYIWFAGI